MSVVSEDEFLAMSLTVKSKSANRTGFAIELRRDGHYYVKSVPPGVSGCRPGDRILEVNGTPCSSFKSQKHANALIDTFHMEIVPVDNDFFDEGADFIPQKGMGAPPPSNQVSRRARAMPNQMNSPNGVGKKHLPESLKKSVQKKKVPRKHMPRSNVPPERGGGNGNMPHSPTRAKTTAPANNAISTAPMEPPKGRRRRETVEYLSSSEGSDSEEESDEGSDEETESVDSDEYDDVPHLSRPANNVNVGSPKQASEHGKRGSRREVVEDMSASDYSSDASDNSGGHGDSVIESDLDDDEESMPEESKDARRVQTQRGVVGNMSASDHSFEVHVSDASDDDDDDNYVRNGNAYVPSGDTRFNSHQPMQQNGDKPATGNRNRRGVVEYHDSDSADGSEGSIEPQGNGERRDLDGYYDSGGDSESGSGSDSDDHQVSSSVPQSRSNTRPNERKRRDVVEYHDSDNESNDESNGPPFRQDAYNNGGKMEPKGRGRRGVVEYHDSDNESEDDLDTPQSDPRREQKRRDVQPQGRRDRGVVEYHDSDDESNDESDGPPSRQDAYSNGRKGEPKGRRRRDVVEYHDSDNEDEPSTPQKNTRLEQNERDVKSNERKRRDVVEYHDSDDESSDEADGPPSRQDAYNNGGKVESKGRGHRGVVEYHDSDDEDEDESVTSQNDPRKEQNGRGVKPKGKKRRDVVEYHDSDDESGNVSAGPRNHPSRPQNGGNVGQKRRGRSDVTEYHDSDSDTAEHNGEIVQPNRKGRRDVVEYHDSESENESMRVNGTASQKNQYDSGISMSSSDDFSLPDSHGNESESVSIATSCQSDEAEDFDDTNKTSGKTPNSRTQPGRRTDVEYLSESDNDGEDDGRSEVAGNAPRGTRNKPRWKDEVEYLPDNEDDIAVSAGSRDKSKVVVNNGASRGTKTKPRWKDEVEYLPDSDADNSHAAGSRKKSGAVVDDGYASGCETCPLCGSQLSLAGDGVVKKAHDEDAKKTVVYHDDDDESIGVEEVQAVEKQSRNQLSHNSLLHSSARLRDSRRSFQPEGDWDRPYVSNYKPMDRWMVTVKIDPEYDSGLTIVPYEDELYVADIDFGPFYDTGLDTGDKILSINGKKVPKQVSTVEDAEVLIESREKTTLFVLRPDPEDEGYRWVKGVL